ncbi:hypothetical protein FGG08_006997, partial [Glutinoglossum americanum]
MPKRKFELEDNQEAISGSEKVRKIDCDDTRTLVANPPGRRLASDDYTVGWICAIITEYVAAQAFLDEKHERLDISPNDNNDYTLGKIGKHNTVIAVLPDGEYGTSSAAGVARDMLHSFPNVRIGLMVGIGGGAPSRKHDIRLGDIVVSAPRDREGGVFQYDFGKTIQNRSFQYTRFLNQPPTVLRAAVNGLKAQYESEGHQLETAINAVLNKKPRLQKKYKRPDSSSDRLYQSGVTHPPNDQVDCATACGDDLPKLILRPERTKEEDNPAIHNGLIASANQLMKDASVRDKLAAEKDVLCFEMEAAGLMNHFPCLVIRGICDYSDTHKNKEWQGYAAMAAAAYAKDLLCRIPLNKVEAENKISDLLSDVLDTVSRTRANVETMRSKLDRNEDLEMLNWLMPIDYGPQQSDYIRKRQPETGQWLLDSQEFQTWLQTSKQTLYCPGIPGAGKTILTSIVVDNLIRRSLNNPSIGIAYLYCNFRKQEEQKAEDLLASLLKQLSQGQSSLPDSVRALYGRHRQKGTRPLFDETARALQSVATIYSRVFIAIDALDECQVSGDCRSRFLSEIFNLQVKCEANIFATSRFVPEITEKFNGSMLLEIYASNEDVRKYLKGHMSQLPSFVSRNVDLQEEIMTEIAQAVDGMFLLAQLHLDSLIGTRSPKAIKMALGCLRKESILLSNDKAKVLDSAYEQAMKRIEGQMGDQPVLAKQVLAWITCAKRALTTSELQHALGVEIGTSRFDEENLPELEDIVSACAGLVTVDEESDIIRLVHYTTQKYFEWTWTSWFPGAQIDITNVCVTYLSFDTFETGFCQSDGEFEARLQTNVLYDYAARNWGYHAHTALIKEDLILNLLESRAKVSAASQAMIASRSYSGHSQRAPRQMTGVHVAAYFGLVGTIVSLLKNGYNPELQDSYRRTPLSWAAGNGHEAAVKLLLATEKVDLDSKDSFGQTPLSRAAESGHEAVVKLLLATEKVDLDSKDSFGQTPLSQSGHEAVVKLLLATKKVDLDSKDSSFGQTPLSWAAENGHEAVVKLLLATEKVDLDSRDSTFERTPLSWAAGNGHEAVVKLLLATEK